MREAIQQFIREDVRSDIHGDLYGVDRAADAIANYIQTELLSRMKEEIRHAMGAYVDGLYEAIDIIKDEFMEN
jgi:bifunctional pyridoxal-dependent enzyme with beta-cystathionase and maltose regulon repressor activities